MGKFHDFETIKKEHPIEDAMRLLGLVMKPGNNQFRGVCPACKAGGERALVITPEKAAFYCFSAGKGGDVISLVAHILDKPVKDAAEWLCGTGTGTSRTVQSSSPPESDNGFSPLSYLEHSHDAVVAVGFDPEVAKALGIGYAPRGIMRGTVAIPVRDERGVLQGYVGITEARLPPSFSGNVVKLHPKTA